MQLISTLKYHKKIFITGTDTGIGKTYVTVQLLTALAAQGISCLGLKPIASGCELTAEGLRNDDALAIAQAASIKLPYAEINPFAFAPAIAPHLAARQAQCTLTVAALLQACMPAFAQPADVYLIEGAGGWLVPLNEQETLPDFVKAIDAAVIMVVGMRVGCLNHAMLTYQAMQDVNVIGWIANCVTPEMLMLQENITYLTQALPIPLLATIPYAKFVHSKF